MSKQTSQSTADVRPDWEVAGQAWEHAALDWAFGFEPHARDSVEHVFDALAVGPGVDVLDLACGSGYALGVAQRRGAKIAGIDASAGLINIANRRAPAADLVTGSMFDLPWDNASFDVATSFNGIWGGCQAAIDEAYRVLRPGGSLGITFWGPGRALDLRDFFIVVGTTAPGVAQELKDLAAIGSPGVAEGMLERAGFDVTERASTSGIIEASSDDEAWRILRSPGAVLPSLENTGEAAMRSLVLDAVGHCRRDDGSYRIVNEVTHVIGVKES